MKKIVVLPGGYHPYHAGHYSLYKAAMEKFPDAHIYLAATNDTKTRPFPFEVKRKLAKLAGVDETKFVQVKSPFKAEEITQKYDPERDVLIFIRSEKDRNEQPKPGGTKKDGSPSYFQPYGKSLKPFSQHAYMDYLPTIEFGPGIKSATEIRNSWPNLTDRQKLAMVMSLYPITKNNEKLANVAVKMLDHGIIGDSKEITESVIMEGKGHLDHPEDLVFLEGIPGAKLAIAAIEKTIQNPSIVTIKWDGYPALIFGRDPQGRFSIMDKHMFNKKDGTGRQVFSVQDFIDYDRNRGVNRGDLYNIIANVWDGLEKADKNKGYYWGDLLFGSPLQEKSGQYSFRPNPNGIAYTVDANSEVGKLLKGKKAAIAVHQYIPADAMTTDQSVSLDGSIGKLKNNSAVAIVPSKMPTTPNLKINNTLKSKAEQAINQNQQAVDQFLNTAPQKLNVFAQHFTTYVNRKIVSGDLSNLIADFVDYIKQRNMTDTAKAKILDHIQQNLRGLTGIFKIWIAIYNLKMNVVSQLNKAATSSPVQGYLQDGTQTQEGFVANGLKFVDRMGFSRQNLAAKVAESVTQIKSILPNATPKQKEKMLPILSESISLLKQLKEEDRSTVDKIDIDRTSANLTSDETETFQKIIRMYPEASSPMSAVLKYIIHSVEQSDSEDFKHEQRMTNIESRIDELEKNLSMVNKNTEIAEDEIVPSGGAGTWDEESIKSKLKRDIEQIYNLIQKEEWSNAYYLLYSTGMFQTLLEAIKDYQEEK